MSQYLLATYSVEDAAPGTPPSPEEMKAFMKSVMDLEEEMDAAGAFLFGGALHGPDAATVIDATGDDVITTDGPFAEAKEHIAGFYIIEAADLDEALEWAAKVTAAVSHSIEVRPFRATGKVADHQPA